MRPIDVPELDIRHVSAAYRHRVLAICPEQLALAIRVLDRLEPERWKLEWYLPWWLGHAFALGTELSYEIVLSNVLGLAAIRLQDDLADGEVETDDVAGAAALGTALYNEAVAVYGAHFDGSSTFWDALAGYMSEWQSATHEPHGASGVDATTRDRQHLARRGAPLKIAARALCLLADRMDRFPALDLCLDHALAALVLYDHICDWERDLAAGRWNAFVAGSSTLPQTTPYLRPNRSSVLVGLMTQGAASTHFAAIQAELSAAIEAADLVPLASLADHLRKYALQTAEQGMMLQAHYDDLAEHATKLMFGRRAALPGYRGAAVT